jgi:hypothetical protein
MRPFELADGALDESIGISRSSQRHMALLGGSSRRFYAKPQKTFAARHTAILDSTGSASMLSTSKELW